MDGDVCNSSWPSTDPKESENALAYAADIADATDGSITVVHAVDPTAYDEGGSEPITSLSDADARLILESVADAEQRAWTSLRTRPNSPRNSVTTPRSYSSMAIRSLRSPTTPRPRVRYDLRRPPGQIGADGAVARQRREVARRTGDRSSDRGSLTTPRWGLITEGGGIDHSSSSQPKRWSRNALIGNFSPLLWVFFSRVCRYRTRNRLSRGSRHTSRRRRSTTLGSVCSRTRARRSTPRRLSSCSWKRILEARTFIP